MVSISWLRLLALPGSGRQQQQRHDDPTPAGGAPQPPLTSYQAGNNLDARARSCLNHTECVQHMTISPCAHTTLNKLLAMHGGVSLRDSQNSGNSLNPFIHQGDAPLSWANTIEFTQSFNSFHRNCRRPLWRPVGGLGGRALHTAQGARGQRGGGRREGVGVMP